MHDTGSLVIIAVGASSSHNGLSNYVFAACALLLQCLQSMSTEYTEHRDHVPLDLHLLQQWASLAVVAYWLYLLAAIAATTIVKRLCLATASAGTQQPATKCLSH